MTAAEQIQTAQWVRLLILAGFEPQGPCTWTPPVRGTDAAVSCPDGFVRDELDGNPVRCTVISIAYTTTGVRLMWGSGHADYAARVDTQIGDITLVRRQGR